MRRILIVDDQPHVIRVIKLGLEGGGYEVDTALNGSECLVKLCDKHPDLLVTDIDMPRMGGKELCRVIQQQFPDRAFPIIVLTSRTEMEHRDWTRDIGNLAFMEKPVSIRRLLSHIGESLADDSHPGSNA